MLVEGHPLIDRQTIVIPGHPRGLIFVRTVLALRVDPDGYLRARGEELEKGLHWSLEQRTYRSIARRRQPVEQHGALRNDTPAHHHVALQRGNASTADTPNTLRCIGGHSQRVLQHQHLRQRKVHRLRQQLAAFEDREVALEQVILERVVHNRRNIQVT